MDRLDKNEVYVALPGRTGKYLLRRGPVASWIRARLYRPSSAAMLPLAIERAYQGDWRIVWTAFDLGQIDFKNHFS